MSCSATKHGESFEVFKRTDATIMPRNPLTSQNASYENAARSSSVHDVRYKGEKAKKKKKKEGRNLSMRR